MAHRSTSVGSVQPPEASRQAAIVMAFESVKSSVTWDETRRQFVAN